jgi:hypothetical protein
MRWFMKKIVFILLSILVIQSGCKKFSEFQVDPNKSTIATPDLLLNSIIQNAFQSTSISAALACRQMVYTDASNVNQYYGWDRAGFGTYGSLRQVLKMEEAAVAQGKPEYLPLAKFFRAWYFLQLTQTYGDVPYSNALKGDDGLGDPAYDKQEDIYLGILDDLKAANNMIGAGTADVQGDILYNGKMQQWKRAINALSLRVLMSLSLKEGKSKIDVKQRFAEIVNNPTTYPLLTGNEDNVVLKFYDLQGNRYPYFNNNDLQTADYMEESFVNLLKDLKDVRLFSFADKAPKFAALPADDFNAYGGAKGSAPVNENNARTVAGEISKINPRFYNNPTNEPSIALGYPEQQFILAEGVLKGWISGSASDFYEKGIRASMTFYHIDQPTIDKYVEQASVKLSAANGLQQVITQKYIASFFNSGWQPFYEQRRTGFPAFDVAGSGMLNDHKIPKRWMYPESELQLNKDHVLEAISRQYPEGDNINGVMWLIRP